MPRGIYKRKKRGKTKASKKFVLLGRKEAERIINSTMETLTTAKGPKASQLVNIAAGATEVTDNLQEIIRDIFGQIRTSNHVDENLLRRHGLLKLASDHIEIATALLLRAADL